MDQVLDVFGQQPGLNKLYTQLCLAFPLPSAAREQAVQSLRNSLYRLTDAIRWVAGEVIYNEASKSYCIRPAGSEMPVFVIKDLTDCLPSLENLKATGYPAQFLDEKLIAPCETIRSQPEQPAPVFLIQANYVHGGLLLVICGLHGCMDMAAQGCITSLFAKVCSGEDLTKEDADNTNLPGKDLIPLLDDDQLEAANEKPPEKPSKSPAPQADSPKAKAVWSYIIFSGEALAKLKSEATESITSDFVSTDDCLSAVLWQSITRSRLTRLSDGQVGTVITRTVDARSAAGLPAAYTGNAAVKTACHMTIQELMDSPLGKVASDLREALSGVGYQLRLEATLLSQGSPTNKPTVDPSTGVNLSSWAKERTYELDIGPDLGKPEAARRPAFEAWESLVYLMPKKTDGEIAVAMCLKEEDVGRLNRDAELAKYAHFVD